ncbi:MAG: SusC/RagA family TonB-linked outer membrane protein [Ignavibacteriae bacterium]|nr:SusC/RagA family TonB-linked outer membrane protein [Ignavibacteriota bacterium]MCB9214744.1 SusC/RagA family TonB-linked outer membrane protein [Ignavibacteria bacterium]
MNLSQTLYAIASRLKPRVCYRHSWWMLATVTLCLSVFSTEISLSQTVQGTIIDADTRQPIPGATVQIPELRIGTAANADGKYYLVAVPAGTHQVVVTAIGYQKMEQTIGVQAGEDLTQNFELSYSALELDEVVVVGLSGSQERRKLGNVIAEVDGTDIARAVTPNAIDALSGRVTGASVTRNGGAPGAGTYITIRGKKTVLGSSQPLYVVDGTIIDNTSLGPDTKVGGSDFQGGNVNQGNRAIDINPHEIESIEVLKGASAAAIYGSRAANGVMLITTKRGRGYSEKPVIASFTSFQLDNKVGDIDLQTEYGQQVPYQPGRPGSTNSYGERLADGTQTFDHDQDIFRTGQSLEQVLSVSGSSGPVSYLVSGTVTDMNGFVTGSELGRQSFRFNADVNALPNVLLRSNSNFILINNDFPQNGSNTSGILLGSLRTPPEFDNSEILEADGTQRRFGFYDNPLWTEEFNTFNTKINRFIHSTSLSWDPLDWLGLNGQVGIDRYDHFNVKRLAVGSADSDGRLGEIRHDRLSVSSINLDLSATVNRNFGEDVEVNLTLGSQTIWESTREDESTGTNTLPFFDQLPASATTTTTSAFGELKTVGLFAQVTGTLWDKLSLTAAIRRDGSSGFGASEQFHTYPKVGGSYTISKETFFDSMRDIFSNVRLRASYGEAGSPSLPGAYATSSLYGTFGFADPWDRGTSAGRSGFIGIRQGNNTAQEFTVAGNPEISPERSKEIEAGIDIGLLDERVSIEATFYHQDIEDLILNVPVPGSTGYDQQLRNAGKMWNEGFELGIGFSPIRTENFTWESQINYSTNENMVTELKVKPEGLVASDDEGTISLEGGFTGTVNVAAVGQPVGVLRGGGWLRDINGDIVYAGDTYTDKNGVQQTAADAFELPINGTPVIDPAPVILANTNPDFQWSWINEFTLFKDISFGFLIDASIGQEVWNGTRGALYNFGTHGDTRDRDEPWMNERGEPVIYTGTDTIDIVPGLQWIPGQQLTRESYYRLYANSFLGNDEVHVEDASYIKLREVHVRYDWHGLRKWNIETVGFGVSVRNLLTISDYSGYDPEVNNFQQAEGRGYDYFTLPQTRSVRFSLSVTY